MNCKNCDKEYQPLRNSQFCGGKCRDAYRNFYTKGGGLIKHCICPTCSTQFTTNQKRKYCSPKCSPWYKEPVNEPIRTCLSCKKEYKPIRRAQRYCTKKCNNTYVAHKNNKYYQTKEWKLIRATFIQGHTTINGIQLSNKYCIECYIKQNRLNDMYAVDHIIPRNEGGLDIHANLQSLCKSHHQSKSAIEGNNKRIKYNKGTKTWVTR